MPYTVLIVEDEPKLSSLLADYLQQAAFDTHVIDNGSLVDAWVREHQPDLMLLDLMLPGKDGIEICKDIRSYCELPIIMITAKVEEIDRLIGLELGADDYICKPFSPREVVARVKNILKRLHRVDSKSRQDLPKSLTLDKDAYCVKLGSQELRLTSVEFELLNVLVNSPGKIFSRDQLMNRIYTDHRVVSGRTIDSHIKKLRKKLSQLTDAQGNAREWISSVYSVGYKVDLD